MIELLSASEFWKSPRLEYPKAPQDVKQYFILKMLPGQVSLGKVELIKFKLFKEKNKVTQLLVGIGNLQVFLGAQVEICFPTPKVEDTEVQRHLMA